MSQNGGMVVVFSTWFRAKRLSLLVTSQFMFCQPWKSVLSGTLNHDSYVYERADILRREKVLCNVRLNIMHKPMPGTTPLN